MGVDYESDYALSGTIPSGQVTTGAITAHEWRNAGNSGANNFGVFQIGSTLYFHDLGADSISTGLKAFTVDLTTFSTGYAASFGSEPVDISAGKGVLFVSSKDTDPFYIEYDPATDSITTTGYDIKIRDFEGLVSTESSAAYVDQISYRPTTLDKAHEYITTLHNGVCTLITVM
jgi:hypothetical protein